MWGVGIFQIFMSGIFVLRKGVILSFFIAPLLLGTLFWAFYTVRTFDPLSKNVNLSSVCEVQRGVAVEDVQNMKISHPVTSSQRSVFYCIRSLLLSIILQQSESTKIRSE